MFCSKQQNEYHTSAVTSSQLSEEKSADVYISCTYRDLNLDALVRKELLSRKISVFNPRADFDMPVADAIKNAKAVIPIITKNSLGSEYTRSEVSYVLHQAEINGVLIIPILAEDVEIADYESLDELWACQYIYAEENDFKSAAVKLAERLENIFSAGSTLRSLSKNVDKYLCQRMYDEALKWQKEHMELCYNVFAWTDGKYISVEECSLSQAKYVNILIDMGRYEEALDYSIDALNHDESYHSAVQDVFDILSAQFALCCLKFNMNEDDVEKLIKERLIYASFPYFDRERYLNDLMERFTSEKEYAKSIVLDNRQSYSEEYGVFISYKSEDEVLATNVYNYLIQRGVKVFYSKETLPQLGRSEYERVIFEALEKSKHMILVASNPDYLKTSWVRDEWTTFNNEIREGRKTGNLILLLADDVSSDKSKLPTQLRKTEIVKMSEFRTRLLAYLR